MPKWLSLDEAFENGFAAGRKACTSDRVEQIEDDDHCDEMAENILDDLDEENKEPYSDEGATNKEIKEFEAGFVEGFYEGYRELVGGAAADNPEDDDDEGVEEVK